METRSTSKTVAVIETTTVSAAYSVGYYCTAISPLLVLAHSDISAAAGAYASNLYMGRADDTHITMESESRLERKMSASQSEIKIIPKSRARAIQANDAEPADAIAAADAPTYGTIIMERTPRSITTAATGYMQGSLAGVTDGAVAVAVRHGA